MSDPLEKYIKEHRVDFDTLEPSEKLWSAVQSEMNTPKGGNPNTKFLKYFGLGGLVIGSFLYYKMITEDPGIETRTAPPKVTQEEGAPKSVMQDPISTGNPKVPSALKQSAKSFTPIVQTNSPASTWLENANPPAEQGSAPVVNTTPPASPSMDQSVITGEGVFSGDTLFSGINSLELDCSMFNVDLTPNQSDKVIIHTEIKIETHGIVYNKPDFRFSYVRHDSVLKIKVFNKNRNMVIFGGVYNACLNMSLSVPSHTSLVVNNSSGNVSAKGLEGEICDIRTGSGNITLDDIRSGLTLYSVSGNLTASGIKGEVKATSSSGDQSFDKLTGGLRSRSVSGDVNLRELKGSIFEIHSSSGDITFEDVFSTVSVSSVSGDIFAKNIRGDVSVTTSSGNQEYKVVIGDMRAKSVSGEINLTNVRGNAELITSSGNIKMDYVKGNLILKSVSGNLTGDYIELTDKLEAKSSSGDIRMGLQNNSEDLSYDLHSGSGNIVVNRDGKKCLSEGNKLVLQQGRILVKGESISGDQTYR